MVPARLGPRGRHRPHCVHDQRRPARPAHPHPRSPTHTSGISRSRWSISARAHPTARAGRVPAPVQNIIPSGAGPLLGSVICPVSKAAAEAAIAACRELEHRGRLLVHRQDPCALDDPGEPACHSSRSAAPDQVCSEWQLVVRARRMPRIDVRDPPAEHAPAVSLAGHVTDERLPGMPTDSALDSSENAHGHVPHRSISVSRIKVAVSDPRRPSLLIRTRV